MRIVRLVRVFSGALLIDFSPRQTLFALFAHFWHFFARSDNRFQYPTGLLKAHKAHPFLVVHPQVCLLRTTASTAVPEARRLSTAWHAALRWVDPASITSTTPSESFPRAVASG